jgi:mannosidase alpha-like ER degradation enhancer 1
MQCNIRLLGGLISGHILAKEHSSHLKDGPYQDQLLHLAENLGSRFLPAFETPTGLPYAWINLKYGVMENETTETSTSGCGSLILEMGALSRLTGDSRYEAAALRALRKLWSMRSSLNLVGTTLDVLTGKWIEYSSGIGAGTTLYIFPCDLLIMCLYPAVSILSLHNILLRHNNDSFVSCLQELIHFMSI